MAQSHPIPTADHPPSTKTCLCSPTTHPGSFRCSLHRASRRKSPLSPPRSSSYGAAASAKSKAPTTASSARSECKRRKLKLARAMSAEEVSRLVRSSLLQSLIGPSSHDLRRRRRFVARPSRFRALNDGINPRLAVC